MRGKGCLVAASCMKMGWHWLAHRTAEDITCEGIRLLLEHTARAIDPANHLVTVVGRREQISQLPYDRLGCRCYDSP